MKQKHKTYKIILGFFSQYLKDINLGKGLHVPPTLLETQTTDYLLYVLLECSKQMSQTQS